MPEPRTSAESSGPPRVGTELGTIVFPVDRSKVRELARALGDEDPLYADPDAASGAGLPGIPAPLTFSVCSTHWRPEANVIETLGLDLRRALHGECRWEFLQPVLVGDELTATRRVSDVTTRQGKRGGTMTLVSIETELVNQRGELAVRQTDVLIETGD